MFKAREGNYSVPNSWAEHFLFGGYTLLHDSVFRIERLCFGVELCIDHKRQRLQQELHQCFGKNATVDVQLVLTKGLHMHNASIATEGSVYYTDGFGPYTSGRYSHLRSSVPLTD